MREQGTRRNLAVGTRAQGVAVLTVLAILVLVFPVQGTAQQTRVTAASQVNLNYGETQTVSPGVTHTEFVVRNPKGRSEGDLLNINLNNTSVSTDLLFPGAVAARDEVSDMAENAHAVAAVNGDFFDIGETNAPKGPAIADGDGLKASLPNRQNVFAVSLKGVARLDRISLQGRITTPDDALVLDGLNQSALEVGGIVAFTPVWGAATRKQATCGTSPDATCSENTTEVVVRDNVVTEVHQEPGSGAIPQGTFILVGREAGADELRKKLQPGEQVRMRSELSSQLGGPLEFAIGGNPILLRDGVVPQVGLGDPEHAPRTAAGASRDGRRLYLVTVDGRSAKSVGLRTKEVAEMMRKLGADDALNLDDGGSSTLVAREPGEQDVTVQNVPSDGSLRLVDNGIGIFSNGG
ncbi:MAG TPA: phosphodiester glycosidase family protein [Rubrobacter sp.]|nr:phosphodiester glycosidase family protein [Rubrobacter sp.]